MLRVIIAFVGIIIVGALFFIQFDTEAPEKKGIRSSGQNSARIALVMGIGDYRNATDPFYFAQSTSITPPLLPIIEPLAPGQVFTDRLQDGNSGPEMVVIPAGQFRMGDIQGGGYDDEQPVHRVNIDQFAMGKYEVTVGEFRQFVNATGYKTDAEKERSCWALGQNEGASWRDPRFSQAETHPVVCVSWNDGIAYAEWLTQQTGKQYRLPTEAEWEYATRAGTEYSRYWGNNFDDACGYVNVADKTAKKKFSNWTIHNCTDDYIYTAPVGSFKSNVFGLFDMLGNVWEWTCSEYEDKYNGKEKKCGSKNHDMRFVVRGGSWINKAMDVRAAAHSRFSHDNRYNNIGFRLAR
ncbi:MAG: formylglycine-generating enzyme family protein [Gammaproteobacteria bacterium]|nr:MAG: formylglycine-generating enzyme family protein [Gammaproteobacteria bacterium]RKZ39060.1 MAG: formylglycine-generating enzyme family protein [Gammaproteobacteria bacterium]